MSGRQMLLIVDDDPSITEALSFMLEQPGRTTLVCSDVEAAEILLARYPVTHLVTDVQFSGDFGFEGLHFLSRARRLVPTCRIVLMTGNVTESLAKAAKSFGASEVLAKPFGCEELERALGEHGVLGNGEPYEIIRFPSLEEIIDGDDLAIVFQPIVRFSPNGVEALAYEALLRIRGPWLHGGPEMLFEYAGRRQQLVELNLAAIKRAFDSAADLPGTPLLFVNVDPLVFAAPSLIPTLMAATERSGVRLTRVILEVTERSGFADHDKAGLVFDELRALGLRFALDDHASAYSHLALVNRICPSFMKISNTFGTDFELDPTRAHVVQHIVNLARDLGCMTILEGIESHATTCAAEAMGVDLAQGYYFGRPSAASHWTETIEKAA